jgi:hypothetical protein
MNTISGQARQARRKSHEEYAMHVDGDGGGVAGGAVSRRR